MLIDDVHRDALYALRGLRRTPGFSAAVVATLAIGIGANTAIFSALEGIVLRALPYANADRLVRLYEEASDVDAPEGARPMGLSKAEFEMLRDSSLTLSHVGVYLPATMTYAGRDRILRLHGTQLTPAILAMLDAAPVIGRLFEAREDSPADHVIVLSDGAWSRLFGRDPAILGRSMSLEGIQYSIVGVMPRDFHFPDTETEFWIPLAFPERGARLVVTGRVSEGYSRDAAADEITSLLARFRTTRGLPPPPPPPPPPPGNGRRMTLEEAMAQAPASAINADRRPAIRPPPSSPRVRLVRLDQFVIGTARSALLILAAAAVFVLLIACANVANLLLARNTARVGEIAVRRALGASRGRLARQLMTETFMLAAMGGVISLGLAFGGVTILRTFGRALPRAGFGPSLGIPRLQEVSLDLPVLGFTIGLTIVTAFLAGLLPAIRHGRPPASEFTHGSHGRTTTRLLVAAEIAAAMLLFIGGALLTRSLVNLWNVAPGFDPGNILTFQVVLAHDRPLDPFRDDVVERLRMLPHVRAAAFADQPAMGPAASTISLRTAPVEVASVPPPPPPGGSRLPQFPEVRMVGGDYFRAMGIHVIEGRDFNGADRSGTSRVMLVNHALARSGYVGAHPIGRHVYSNGPTPVEIIGIVDDARLIGFDQEPGPQVFVPSDRIPKPSTARSPGPLVGVIRIPYFILRTDGNPLVVLNDIRRVVAQLEPSATLDNVATMEQIVSNTMVRPRFYSVLLAIFAAIAALLAFVGIYGLVSYTVTQRAREVGIRMALGASPLAVMRLFVQQAAMITGVGIVCGVGAAATVTRVLANMLFGVAPLDPATYIFSVLTFAAISLIACFVPARRATRIDPAVTLRCD